MSVWHKQRVSPAVIVLKGAVLIIGKVILRANILCSASETEKARPTVASWREKGATDAQQRLWIIRKQTRHGWIKSSHPQTCETWLMSESKSQDKLEPWAPVVTAGGVLAHSTRFTPLVLLYLFLPSFIFNFLSYSLFYTCLKRVASTPQHYFVPLLAHKTDFFARLYSRS